MPTCMCTHVFNKLHKMKEEKIKVEVGPEVFSPPTILPNCRSLIQASEIENYIM